MAVKNWAASMVLGLLFVSLIVINLTTGRNQWVTFFSVLIMAVSLLIALTGSWREIGALGLFAGIVSLAMAYLFGRAHIGRVGAFVLPLIWLGVLALIFRWTSRNMLTIPRDRAFLIQRTYTGTVHIPVPPLAAPIMPLLERKLAEIPLYELSQDIDIKKINTKAGHDITGIDVHIHYKVVDPRRAFTGIPNRGQVQTEIARELGQDLNTARNNPAFWEKLLGRQMRLELDDILREVIYQEAKNAVDVYERRKVIADEVHVRLKEAVKRWGVEVGTLEFDRVEVDGYRFKMLNMERILAREARVSQALAEREATRIRLTRAAEAEVEAQRVSKLVQALHESGINLKPEDIEEIVLSAIRASSELSLEEQLRYLPETSSLSQQSGEKRDYDKK